MDSSAPRVLVVDDEDNISFLVGSALRLQGYRVECAATGAEALAAAAVLDPQVVVLDIQLPDFDGYEVLRRLRAACGPPAVGPLSCSSLRGVQPATGCVGSPRAATTTW